MSEATDLEKKVKKLESVIQSLDKSARMLVRRDLELRRANEKLESLDKEKSEFVSIAAHQLRTPLSAIRWAQQMLLDGDMGELNSEQKQLLQQSQESILRMVSLVHDLLSVDHLEYGQVVYKKQAVELGKVVHDVVNELQPMAAPGNIRFDYIPPDRPITVCIDTDKVKEAVANIVNNALKYTLHGGTVTVQVLQKETEAIIECIDTGIGVPSQDHSRLFKKFSRANNAKKIDADGSGLGLFIVQKIIEAHGGAVACESAEGKGSTFTISLPINS